MAVAHIFWMLERELDTVPVSHVKGLTPPVFDSKLTYKVFYHSDGMPIEEYKKTHSTIQYYKKDASHHKPGYYDAMVIMVKGNN